MSIDDQTGCIILGGGGHASVIIDALRAGGTTECYGILDRNCSLWGKEVLGVPVLGGDELLPQLMRRGATQFVVGLGGVGDNRPRRRLFQLGLQHGLKPLTVCHPAAILSPFATLGDGSVVLPAAVVNAGAVLGANVIVNTGAIVEHDCVVGDHAHIATGSRLCSAARVGIGAHIGAGATVRQSIAIGEGAIVGAGAAVVKDVDPWTVVAGVPARRLEGRQVDMRNSSG
ncbi:MAG: acetyltransferase [SAR202 cluster bacterium]|nr:acetyltransferase [SAR202 cluster bacterium]